MPPKKGTKKAQSSKKGGKEWSDEENKLSLDINQKLQLAESDEEVPVASRSAFGGFAALTGVEDQVQDLSDDDGGGLMGAITAAAAASQSAPAKKKEKKKKRTAHSGFTDDEDPDAIPPVPSQAPIEMSAEDLYDEPVRKSKKKKAKPDTTAQEDLAEPVADQEAVPAPATTEPAAEDQSIDVEDDDIPKTLSKKEKEKLKKQRQKEKEKAARASSQKTSDAPAVNEKPVEPSVASTEKPVEDEEHDGDDADEATSASKNKKKKKKAGAKDAPEAEATSAKGKAPKVSKQVLAMRELLLAKQKAEAEAAAAAEAERQRLEEAERKEQEERDRIEAAKLAKKQKQKEKEAQQKAAGTFKTAVQRKEEARQQAQREALLASGVKVAGLDEKEATGPKKPVYTKKKGPAKQSGPRELAALSLETQQQLVEEHVEPPQVEVPTATETEAHVEKDDWDASDEDQADVKDAWDAESDKEDAKPAVSKPSEPVKAVPSKTQPASSEPQVNGNKSANGTANGQKDAAPSSQPRSIGVSQTTSGKQAQLAKKPAAAAQDTESPEEESSEDESDSDDDSDDDSSSEEELTAAQQVEMRKKAEAAQRKKARVAAALAARSKDDLRSPICCILGHVDTGKTKLLDKIRQTNVQEGEAGGITQQIGATFFPMEAVIAKTAVLGEDNLKEYKLPGLLIIDTPGHESFTNLRTRGSSLCNIAILVVDIVHGLEPQTLESLRLLRDRKTPFIVALNKIDRCYGWKAIPNAGFRESIASQSKTTQSEFEDRLQKTIVAFAEQGLNAELYTRNKDIGKVVSLVPTSAVTGEGVPDMLMLINKLTQERMSGNLMYLSEVECTVLEVKVIEGLGTTIDVVISNGVLHEGDRIVVCGLNGAIVTQIRALLTPQPMKEMRIKGSYVHHKEVKASLGVKIVAPDLEKAIAGSRMLLITEDDDEEELKKDIMSDLTSLLNSVDRTGKGVWVQASTLGALEALLDFLKSSKIPVAGINIGPVHKKDIVRASTMLERAPELAVCLCFDVEIDKDAEKLANEIGLKIFKADIIYHLFDAFTAHNTAMIEAKQKDSAPQAVWPCRLKTLACFAKRDPIILGCDLLDGSLRIGTPLCVVKKDAETGKREVLGLGRITSLEINHKAFQRVTKSQVGAGVAIKIEHAVYEPTRMYGRHFDDTDEIYSLITRQSIDVLKSVFKDEVAQDDWKLIIKLKKELMVD